MKKIWILSIFGLSVLFLTNCNKDNDDIELLEIEQRIYFQYNYINHAWGYQHSGWLIDSSGNVYCYNKPENWQHGDSSGFISASEMDSNILETDSICYRVDKEILSDKIELIYKASKGDISEPIHEMYDSGGAAYSTFIFDENSKTYKKILLKQTGDFRIDNSSPESVELYKWLDSVNDLIRKIN